MSGPWQLLTYPAVGLDQRLGALLLKAPGATALSGGLRAELLGRGVAVVEAA